MPMTKSLFTWFDNNLMKSKADKNHLLVSSNENVTIKTGCHEISNTKREMLLDVYLDSGLYTMISDCHLMYI